MANYSKLLFRIIGALYLLFSGPIPVKADTIEKTPKAIGQSCVPWPEGWLYPIPGQPITALYGVNNTGVGGESSHSGVDIGTASNRTAQVLAANDGVVRMVQDYGVSLQGMTEVIFHGWDSNGNPVATAYGHTRNPLVRDGEVVRKGQEISEAYGFQGTGAFQWHIHFMYLAAESNFRYSYTIFRDPCTLPSIAKWWDGRPGEAEFPSSYNVPDVQQIRNYDVNVQIDPTPHADREEMLRVDVGNMPGQVTVPDDYFNRLLPTPTNTFIAATDTPIPGEPGTTTIEIHNPTDGHTVWSFRLDPAKIPVSINWDAVSAHKNSLIFWGIVIVVVLLMLVPDNSKTKG